MHIFFNSFYWSLKIYKLVDFSMFCLSNVILDYH